MPRTMTVARVMRRHVPVPILVIGCFVVRLALGTELGQRAAEGR